MDLLGLRKLRFAGRLTAEGRARLAAGGDAGPTVVQPCVVTAEPVTTRLDEPVTRRYLADMPEPEEGRGRDARGRHGTEPLPATARSCGGDGRGAGAGAAALPAGCRARPLESAAFAAPGVAPMTDQDAKPAGGPCRAARPDGRRRQGPKRTTEDDQFLSHFMAANRGCTGPESEYVPGLIPRPSGGAGSACPLHHIRAGQSGRNRVSGRRSTRRDSFDWIGRPHRDRPRNYRGL